MEAIEKEQEIKDVYKRLGIEREEEREKYIFAQDKENIDRTNPIFFIRISSSSELPPIIE